MPGSSYLADTSILLRLVPRKEDWSRVFFPWSRATLRPMQITVQLPDDLAQRPDPAREALEAFAIAGYRSGALSAYQTRMLLGFETRYELDGFLKEHEVWERAYSVEDLEKDAEAFERTA
jgi:predicted HTH domain antitoxin